MTFHFDRTRLSATAPGFRVAARRGIERVKAFGASLVRRKAIQDLGRLDDRMLADVGLTRGDLQAAARWSLWGDQTDRLSAAAEERRAARR